MTYNFDEIIDRRNTNSENVEGWRPYIFHCGPERVFPYKDEEFIRMWVADMEFAVAPEILQAITDRVDRRILGYTLVYDKGYYEALRAWCESRYGWSFPKEQLTFSPGVIPALYQLTEDLVKPLNGKVLTLSLIHIFGKAWRTLPAGWRTLVLSSHTEFERCFGKPADKKRKLYNGMIKCDVFMYGNV